ncbi:hypothetical protein BS297_11705 [Rhodococcus erythropolis]|uniref:Uncharacterized protein n=1 Tax=Rhodococcus erythropolis TaxID=1833 RepID=A0A5N5EB71_RHOER|nr:hypothetical protein BS297_11705 [Rhodococcus erythropolis]
MSLVAYPFERPKKCEGRCGLTSNILLFRAVQVFANDAMSMRHIGLAYQQVWIADCQLERLQPSAGVSDVDVLALQFFSASNADCILREGLLRVG